MTDKDLESESVTSSTVKVGGTASAAAGIIRREAPGLRTLWTIRSAQECNRVFGTICSRAAVARTHWIHRV